MRSIFGSTVGSLHGLQHGNPVKTQAACMGPSEDYGKQNDPLVGNKIGGVNVFAGGPALHYARGKLVGALGLSGDTPSTDHIISSKVIHELRPDYLPPGVSATGDDNIVHDIAPDLHGHPVSVGGWRHPGCGADAIAAALPTSNPIRALP